jgi:hypothetical protein
MEELGMTKQTIARTRQYLVVAHYDGDHQVVQDLVRARREREPAHFTLLVPATPPRETLTFTGQQAHDLAEIRLNTALHSLSRTGANVSGEIGDASILDAIGDSLRSQQFDEVILATPPPTVSERFFGDLGSRIQQSENIPVTRVVIPQARAL